MAKFTYFAALGEYGNLSDIVDGDNLLVTVADQTTATLVDPQGDGFTFTGTDLSYSFTGITGGTITDLDVFNDAAAPLLTVENLNVNGGDLWAVFESEGVAGMSAALTAGRDVFIGSSVGDLLMGGRGSDKIGGNGGADIITGGKGNDVLTGGTGADRFVFVAGDGTDRITDFRDVGLASDDQITLATRLYRDMVVTETLNGVELDFGAKGMITVDGWVAADVGRSDFLLV